VFAPVAGELGIVDGGGVADEFAMPPFVRPARAAVGGAVSSPPKMLSRVDLPLPEVTISTTNSPRKMSRSTPRSACTAVAPSP
jgi:hypothetical protein